MFSMKLAHRVTYIVLEIWSKGHWPNVFDELDPHSVRTFFGFLGNGMFFFTKKQVHYKNKLSVHNKKTNKYSKCIDTECVSGRGNDTERVFSVSRGCDYSTLTFRK